MLDLPSLGSWLRLEHDRLPYGCHEWRGILTEARTSASKTSTCPSLFVLIEEQVTARGRS
jgi:hypothetical protein